MTNEQNTSLAALENYMQPAFTPAVIKFDKKALSDFVSAQVAEYANTVVTAENCGDAKKLAAELNKSKKVLDDRRKEIEKEATAPVTQFRSDVKEAIAIIEDARGKITEQVDRFEEEQLSLIADLQADLLAECWKRLSVSESFRDASTAGMARLTHMTKSGKLTSACVREIEALAMADRNRQLDVDLRVAELRGRCTDAGMNVPLEREHVENILRLPADQYHQALSNLIAAELRRQQAVERAAEEKARVEIERQQQEQQAQAQAQEQAQDAPEPQEQQQAESPWAEKAESPWAEKADSPWAEKPEPKSPWDSAPAAPAADAGGWAAAAGQAQKVQRTVITTFSLQVDSNVTAEAIDKKIRSIFAEIGITTLTDVEVK